MTSAHETLARFLPAHLVERAGRPAGAPASDRFPGAVLRVRIEGLDRAVSELDDARARALVDAWYATVTDRVHDDGGLVVAFDADGLLAVWTAEREEGRDAALVTLLRAARCGLRLQRALPPKDAPGGRAGLRIALGAGPLVAHHVGGEEDRWRVVLGGAPIAASAVALAHADLGQVVLTREPWSLIRFRSAGERNSELTVVLEGVRGTLPPLDPMPAPSGAGAPQLWRYAPASLRARITAVAPADAERRIVAVVETRIPGVTAEADAEIVHRAVRAVQRGLAPYDASLESIALDADGLRAVAAFGLPHTESTDLAVRAAQAAVAVRDRLAEQDLAAGIGVATAPAWCGVVGGPRCALLQLGGARGLAAHLAGTGDVLCDTPTWLDARQALEFSSRAPLRIGERNVPVHRPLCTASARPTAIVSVGRREERDLLTDRLRALHAGGPGATVLVEGDPGLGRSHLLGQLADATVRLQLDPLLGRGDPSGQTTPGSAWRDVLSRVLGLEDGGSISLAALAERLGHDPGLVAVAPLLDAIVPLGLPEALPHEATVGGGTDDATVGGSTDAARARAIRELVVALLRNRAGQNPTVLLIDDAHWLDAESWALLSAVRRGLDRLLLVLAAPPVRADSPARLIAFAKAPGTLRRRLRPLSDDEVEELARLRLDAPSVPRGAARLLRARCEGNPLFVEQVLCDLDERGELGAPRPDAPSDVHGVFRARLDRLPEPLRRTLEVASVLGRTFSAHVLRAVHPEPDRLDRDLAALAARELVARNPRGPEETWVFHHELLRDAVYDAAPDALRGEVHGAVAAWYEDHRADLRPFHALIARHAWEAGDVHRAAHHVSEAADAALALGAWDEAVQLLSDAVHRPLDALPDAATRRARWLRQLGEAWGRLGRPDDARRHLLSALDALGESLPEGRLGWSTRLVTELAAWRVRNVRGQVSDPDRRAALRETSRVLTLLAEDPRRPADESRVLGFGAANAATRAGATRERARACAQAARASAAIGRHDEAATMTAAALASAGGIDADADDVDEGATPCPDVHVTVGGWLVATARWEAATRALHRACQLSGRGEDHRLWCSAQGLYATALHLQGDLHDAGQAWLAALERAEDHRLLDARVQALMGLVEGHLRRGDLAHAADALTMLEPLVRVRAVPAVTGRYHALTALFRLRRRRLADAVPAALDALDSLASPTGLDPFAYEAFGAVAEVLVTAVEAEALDDPAEATRAVEALEHYTVAHPIAISRARLHRGTLDWLAGRTDPAVQAFDDAIEAARHHRLPFDEALANLERGRRLGFLDGRGRKSLEDARTLFARLGARLDQDRVTEVVRGM